PTRPSRRAPSYAHVESAYRAHRTSSRFTRWHWISFRCAARSARNRKDSAPAPTPPSNAWRTASPSHVLVGSLVRYTRCPFAWRDFATRRLTVVFPEPSMPSQVTNPVSTRDDNERAAP